MDEAVLAAGDPATYLLGRLRTTQGPPREVWRHHPPGHNFAIWRTGKTSLASKEIGVPDGTFFFVHPQAAVDPEGRLHMVWAEPEVGAAPFEEKPAYSRLLYAYYEGGRWSRPEQIYSGSNISWDERKMSRLRVGPSSRLHLAFSEESTSIIYLRQTSPAGRWEATATGARGTYASLDVSESGRALLATILDVRERDGNYSGGVWFIEPANSQATAWKDPVLASKAAIPALAARPRIFALSPGSVHILWEQATERGAVPEALSHVRSSDGGVTWQDPVKIEGGSGQIHETQVEKGRPEELHVAFVNWAPPPFKLYYARWNGQTWTNPEVLFDETPAYHSVGPLALAVGPDGHAALAWQKIEQPDGGLKNATALKTTYLVSHCMAP